MIDTGIGTAALVAYASATGIFAATPGQSTAVVIQQTVDHGWGAGFAAAVGCAVANVVHATAAGIGLAILVSHFPVVLDVIRLGGGAYLIWLGANSLWRAARPGGVVRPEVESRSGRVAFRQGLVTNLLNPSIATFYLAVVPSFMPPGGAAPGYVLLAVIHISLAFACHNAWAGLFNQIGHLMKSVNARRVFDALAGAALVFLAVRVLGK